VERTVCRAGSLLIGLLLFGTTRAAEPVQEPVFVSGKGGYHTYRIPSVVVTAKGTILAFCEGRKAGRGDAGDVDLLLRRSTDGGKTWGETRVVWDDAENTCGNPCPVVDAKTGTVWLLMTHNLGRDTEAAIVAGTGKGTRTVWLTRSADDGATWARPTEITRDVKKPGWTWYATGPGVGIQLASGRLLIPCDSKSDGGNVRESHVIISDDGGMSWKLGGVVGPQCNESQAVELSDGSVMLNMRSFRGTNRRQVAVSKDGGETFSEPVEDPALVEPACQASVLRLPGAGGGVLFSNPASTRRERMAIIFSTFSLTSAVLAGLLAYRARCRFSTYSFRMLAEVGRILSSRDMSPSGWGQASLGCSGSADTSGDSARNRVRPPHGGGEIVRPFYFFPTSFQNSAAGSSLMTSRAANDRRNSARSGR
jgi:sialidase-1